MSESQATTPQDRHLEHEEELYALFLKKGDRTTFELSALIAILLHLFFFWVTFPDFKSAAPPKQVKQKVFVAKWTPPPPPKKEPPKQVQKREKLAKKVPIPDPTPDEPEPIVEPEPEPEPIPLPPDIDVVVGMPEPPPLEGPLVAGVGGVTYPELIPESKVQPKYPELARRAKAQGTVIMQAIIFKDGTVGDMQVLKSPGGKLGFEEAAKEAVAQWRYKPGMQNGRPVDVYFTINVQFRLN